MIEKRILVVDDDDAIRTLLFTVLRRRGLLVDVARNGAEAIEKLTRCRYAVTLLDLMMPGLSGYDVLNRLAGLHLLTRPLVIVLTAGLEPRDLDTTLVVATVRKPFDIELLAETVAACIETAPAEEQLDRCAPADSVATPNQTDGDS